MVHRNHPNRSRRRPVHQRKSLDWGRMREGAGAGDDELVDAITGRYTVTELREMASEHGVKRKRGDNKRQTAKRFVEQKPGLARRLAGL